MTILVRFWILFGAIISGYEFLYKGKHRAELVEIFAKRLLRKRDDDSFEEVATWDKSRAGEGLRAAGVVPKGPAQGRGRWG